MRILVAGCAGFIGSNLCERLLDEGHAIVGVDDLSTGDQRNLEHLSNWDNFEYVRHNVIEPLPTDGPLAGEFARVFNLACPASPIDFGPRRLHILAVCSQGVWNLLDFCRAKGARLLHTSTSEVYGDPKEHPQRETYRGNVNPIGPRACYDEGKRFAEALIVNYVGHHQVEARIARVFNTYGPRMRGDDGRVLPNFVSQALDGKPLTIHGDGSQTRSFCFVSDLVDGLIRLTESDVTEPVNLGNPVEITIRQFAEEIIRLTDSQSEISFVPRPQDDPDLRRPDIARARERLGWEPQVDRSTGLERTVRWFRDSHTL